MTKTLLIASLIYFTTIAFWIHWGLTHAYAK